MRGIVAQWNVIAMLIQNSRVQDQLGMDKN